MMGNIPIASFGNISNYFMSEIIKDNLDNLDIINISRLSKQQQLP